MKRILYRVMFVLLLTETLMLVSNSLSWCESRAYDNEQSQVASTMVTHDESATVRFDPETYTIIAEREIDVGYRFNVTIELYDVIELFAWQVRVYFNNTLLNATNAYYHPDEPIHTVSHATVSPVVKNDYNETHGYVQHAVSALYFNYVNMTAEDYPLGLGICIVEFEVLMKPSVGETLESSFVLNNAFTYLIWKDGSSKIPCIKENGLYYISTLAYFSPQQVTLIDPAYDLAPDYLGYVDIINVSIETKENELVCKIIVNEELPETLEYIPSYAFMMDEDNDTADNCLWVGNSSENMDTVYFIVFNELEEAWKLEKMIFLEGSWNVVKTDATFAIEPATNNFTVCISIPAAELSQLGAVLPWRVVSEAYNDSLRISDFVPNENEASLEIARPTWISDIDNNAKVDIEDVAIVAKSFGSYLGHPRWNPDADITGDLFAVPDGKVDILDITMVAMFFGNDTLNDLKEWLRKTWIDWRHEAVNTGKMKCWEIAESMRDEWNTKYKNGPKMTAVDLFWVDDKENIVETGHTVLKITIGGKTYYIDPSRFEMVTKNKSEIMEYYGKPEGAVKVKEIARTKK